MGKALDLSGQRFGRLIVIGRDESRSGKVFWRCECDCGKIITVQANNLRSGNTTSCGCLRAENMRTISKKHGKSHTRIHRIWLGMRERCECTEHKHYKDYGRRGITVCSEWKNSFENFYAWAMASGYNPEAKRGECTLDRIDSNGNYCPENCRWATAKEQANNTRRNHWITFEGETHTITEWSEITGIAKSTLINRILLGWSIERALTEPAHNTRPHMTKAR